LRLNGSRIGASEIKKPAQLSRFSPVMFIFLISDEAFYGGGFIRVPLSRDKRY